MAVTPNNAIPLMDGQQAQPWDVYNTAMGIVDTLLLSNSQFNTNFETRLGTGKAGGRTIPGGSAASENLTLQSTSHATKGKILFGSDSGFSGSNNRWGFGTQVPSFDIGLGGEAARVVSMERRTGGGAPNGSNLTIASGGCFPGATDGNAGNVVIKTGISTGAGSSGKIFLQTPNIGVGGGTTDNAYGNRVVIETGGQVGISVTSPAAVLHIAPGDTSQPPLLISNGTAFLTSPVNGAVEFATTWALTEGGVRRGPVMTDQARSAGSPTIGGSIAVRINGATVTLLTT